MEGNFNIQEFIKISQMLHSVTKLDIRLNDQNTKTIYQLTNYSIPAVLHQREPEYAQINDVLQHHDSNHYYHYMNPYGLEYIAAGIWLDHAFNGSILIGPFISSLSVLDLIKDIISKNNLPIGERKQLEQFYQSLPILSDAEYKHMGELLVQLCVHTYTNAKPISSDILKPVLKPDLQEMSIEENNQMIEHRYEHQNKLMDAITRGDKAALNHLFNPMTDLVAFSDRVPGSPIRSSKNIGFVFNTLCRVAAERAGVHSVYLHNISERFAILIERTTNLPHLKKLFVLMANEYCELVAAFSTGHYSPLVKNAVDYILLNLGGSLTLQQIAGQIHANPSHLSRKFKEDTSMTITEYINRKRVEEAKLYLQKGNRSITDVAFMVGFNDLNYFSKVFKKFTALTPSQYLKRKSV
ncbi:helix-turn-helix domain-containing protein [Neobacillus cucumis]|uniref:AraC family transcriptional regulator n=1 Tax=Neobacillus cucumis TaxID=1740721 RepID=A0A2N5HDW2_9BACI|nr:helix-turn-helix domain-containing protein [Neobacillus cucumis]PLS03714.1 AraC family transcriptional regulator [Neobacillus cucumis]